MNHASTFSGTLQEAALRTLATTGGKRGNPLSHRSLVYALGGLRQAYSYGLRCGWVKSNPASLAKAPRDSHQEGQRTEPPKRWTTTQLVAFRAYVDSVPTADEPWVRVGMRLTLCGLRRSEVLGLDWRNVDLKAGSIRVTASRTKTGRGNATEVNGPKVRNSARVVQVEKVHPGTKAALTELWLAQGRPTSGLVIRETTGEPVYPDKYSRRFASLCGEAGVPRLTSIHNIRHTLATALKEAGVPDHQAAALLGHDVMTYRRFYLVTDDDGAAAAAEVAGQVFAV